MTELEVEECEGLTELVLDDADAAADAYVRISVAPPLREKGEEEEEEEQGSRLATTGECLTGKIGEE